MTKLATPRSQRANQFETMQELLDRLGNIPPARVRMQPYPGTATERDLLRINETDKPLCELIDGVLVEKAMGWKESLLGGWLITVLNGFVIPRNMGLVTGEAGNYRLRARLVRLPDVAFVSWSTLPGRKQPKERVPLIAPDLAAEIVSKSNTRREIARKLKEYFEHGVKLVWNIDPDARTVRVYTSADKFRMISVGGSLDGGKVLPGFRLPLVELFSVLDRQGSD